MRLDEIASEVDQARPDLTYYRPTPEQRARLIADAVRDRALWGVDRLGYCLRGVEAEVTEIAARNEGRIYSHTMERLARETAPIQVRNAIATRPQSGHDACGGQRWIQHFSSDYPCSGCWGCGNAQARAAWAISRFVWCAAVAPSHREARVALAGIEALAAIGRAFATIAGFFASFAAMPDKLRADYQRVRIGHWYAVVGGRGTAKEHKGKVGRAVWTGQSDRGTWRVGLEPVIGDRFYVAYGQVRRVEPDEFQAADAAAKDHAEQVRAEDKAVRESEYAAAVKCDAYREEIVLVVAGPREGTIGRLFWIGEKHGRLRCGVRELGTASSERYAKKGEAVREPMWLDATEVRSARQVTTEQAEDAVVRLDAIMVQMRLVHPDFDAALVALSIATRCPIKWTEPARRTRKARAS